MIAATAENARHKVVVNLEGQYSLWPCGRDNAAGWSDTGTAGSREECLAYIRHSWIDMRPISLRQAMEQQAGRLRQAFAPGALMQS